MMPVALVWLAQAVPGAPGEIGVLPPRAQDEAPARPSAAPLTPLTPPASEAEPDGYTLKLALGGTYYSKLYTVQMYGGEVTLGLGGHSDAATSYLLLHLERGRTEHGLTVTGWHLGLARDWAFGAFRVGGELRAGGLSLHRITARSSVSSGSVGAALELSFDLLRAPHHGAGHHVVYVSAAGRADYYDPWLMSGTLSLGYRWDASSRL